MLGALLVTPTTAVADRTSLADAPPIRSALRLRDARHQVTASHGFTINDAYQRSLALGLTYRYYFTNWLGVGVDFMATYFNLDTALTEQVEAGLTTPGQSGRPSVSNPGFLVTAGITLIPIYGKMMLFGLFEVQYDFQFIVGAGYGGYQGEGRIDSGGSFTPMVGLGARLFVSNWIGVELGVRDYIMEMPVVAPANVVNPEAKFVQNFMVTIGVSFFFPPDLEREL